jgi:hypothetical protein
MGGAIGASRTKKLVAAINTDLTGGYGAAGVLVSAGTSA